MNSFIPKLKTIRSATPTEAEICRKGEALRHIGRHSRKHWRSAATDLGRKGAAILHIRRSSRKPWPSSAAHLYCSLPTAVCRLVLVLLTAHCSLLTSSAAWHRQQTGSLAWLHAVFFLDQSRGWIAGSRGTLLSTIDGGRTWQVKSATTKDTIRDVYFVDESNGLLLCERNIYDLKSNDEPRAYLLSTSDGGQSWKRVNMPGVNVDARLTRTIFSPDGSGWAFGEGGAIFKTRDSGASWTRLAAPTRYLLLGGSFIDENVGWLVGAGTTILQTSDGGNSWNHASLPNVSNVRINSTSFVDGRLGWAVGSGGVVFRTINSGRTWRLQSSGVVSDLWDVKFFDALEGWAVGDEGITLHTYDGGLHWNAERNSTAHTLERVFFVDHNHGWAVGFGGTIISYGASSLGTPAPRLRP